MDNTPSKRSRKLSESTVVPLPSIPEDIINDIVLKLPVKSLLRSKSVCKTWCNLINSPAFISKHHKSGPKLSHLLICTGFKNPEEEEEDEREDQVYNNINHHHVFSFRYNDKSGKESSPDLHVPSAPDHVVYVAGSCNGIVCFFDFLPEIFLTNPATREVKRLPPTSIIKPDNVMLLQLGVGFGFHSSNIYDFKVLRVFDVPERHYDPKLQRAEIFTLSSNSWKEIEVGLNKRYLFRHAPALFCANSFHFHVGGIKGGAIVSFDIHTERFTTMDFPSIDYNVVRGCFVTLEVVKEFLSALFRHNDQCMEIWIMKDHGVVESWTKFYRIEPSFGFVRPLCFWMDDQALLVYHREKKELITCDLNKSCLDSEAVVTHGYNRFSRFVVFKETLVSILSQSRSS